VARRGLEAFDFIQNQLEESAHLLISAVGRRRASAGPLHRNEDGAGEARGRERLGLRVVPTLMYEWSGSNLRLHAVRAFFAGPRRRPIIRQPLYIGGFCNILASYKPVRQSRNTLVKTDTYLLG